MESSSKTTLNVVIAVGVIVLLGILTGMLITLAYLVADYDSRAYGQTNSTYKCQAWDWFKYPENCLAMEEWEKMQEAIIIERIPDRGD